MGRRFFRAPACINCCRPCRRPGPRRRRPQGAFSSNRLALQGRKAVRGGRGLVCGRHWLFAGVFFAKTAQIAAANARAANCKKTGKAGPAWISGRRRFGELYLPASPLRIPPAASRTFRAFARASSPSRSASRHMRDAYIMVARSSAPEPAPLMASLPTPHR